MAEFNDLERMRRLIIRLRNALRAAFLEAVVEGKNAENLTTLAELIETGDEPALFAITDRVANQFAGELTAAYVLAGQDSAAFLRLALNVRIDFDQTNFAAVEAMRANRLEFVQAFTAEQRGAVRSVLINAAETGLNPRDAAREFRGVIGLTTRQEAAVRNYRRLLETLSADSLQRELRDRRFDRTVRRAIASDEPLTGQQIDKMVTRYRERSLQFRSQVIARTEALRSAHEGSENLFAQAIVDGDLDPGSIVREWHTAGDERVRSFADSSTSHRSMNGQQRALGVPFTSGAGNLLRFPGDPRAPAIDTVQCRCRVGTTVRIAELEEEAALM